MITPEKIKEKAEQNYLKYLAAILAKQSFFPWEINVGKPPSKYAEFSPATQKLIKASKQLLGYGYTIELKEQHKQSYGLQSLPNRIYFETEIDYLKFLDKELEVSKFKQAIELIITEIPILEPWLKKHPKKILDNLDQWPDLIKVCLYFSKNPRPNLYIRELPIDLHTKFIENNQSIISDLLTNILPENAINTSEKNFAPKFYLRYDEPLIRLRILDPDLLYLFGGKTADISILLTDFQRLNLAKIDLIITENKINFLTVPQRQNSLAIWGSGFQVELHKQVTWLNDCQIYYWGDLDAAGLQILSQYRGYFPHTISLMMDWETFNTFQNLAVVCQKSNIKTENLRGLNDTEKKLFDYLNQNSLRLEQEKISQDFVVQQIGKLI